MNSLGYSVTLDLEHNTDYEFLNDLRSAHSNLPAHVTVVSSLKPVPAKVELLESQLRAIATQTAPFKISFRKVELWPQRKPFKSDCIAVSVRSGHLDKIRGALYRQLRQVYSRFFFGADSDPRFVVLGVSSKVSSHAGKKTNHILLLPTATTPMLRKFMHLFERLLIIV